MKSPIKVFVLGAEGLNWSIDKDRAHTIRFLELGGFKVTSNIFASDLILCVWHKALLLPKFSWLRYVKRWMKKPIVTVISNDISSYPDVLEKIIGYADRFIVPSKRTQKFLEKYNVSQDKIPFFVDPKIFKPLQMSKEEICKKMDIDYERIKGKCIIGSFQRDSLGADLTQPKWQKGPTLLVEILEKLPREKTVFLLAGPRRHYIMKECKKRNIETIFYGDIKHIETGKDDIKENNQSLESINDLYNLSDIYIVSSQSEGGPKAILESALAKTLIFSTPVGFAEDFLTNDLIYTGSDEAVKKIKPFLENPSHYAQSLQAIHKKVSEEMNEQSMAERFASVISNSF
jgi:hypothetical protein